MAIISLQFLAFIAIVGLIYFAVPKKIKWLILLLASYIYYFLSSSKLTIFLIITTISIYFAALAMSNIDAKTKTKCNGQEKETKKKLKKTAAKNKKTILILTIIINFGILVF